MKKSAASITSSNFKIRQASFSQTMAVMHATTRCRDHENRNKMFRDLKKTRRVSCFVLREVHKKIFTKESNIKFHGIPPSGSRVDTCRQTWRQANGLTEKTKVNDAYDDYTNTEPAGQSSSGRPRRNSIIWKYIYK